MISPRTQKAPMPARHVRILLTVFGLRHLFGVAFFAAITVMFYHLGGPGWVVVALAGVAYAVVAALNFRKLLRQYRARLAAESGKTGPGA